MADSVLKPQLLTRIALAAVAAVALGGALAPGAGGRLYPRVHAQAPTVDAIQGTLPDGSNFRAVKPAVWNGTLVLDLDFANRLNAPPSAIEQWMTANGYAIGGISREPVAYRFRQAVDDLLDVRRRFTEKWGSAPRRTLTMGVSRGGFVSRLAMEFRPEIFDGAIVSAGGGAGEVATFNSKLDALWALKTLTGAPLQLVGFASQADAMAENERLRTLLAELRATPLGRSRLALAAAFEQFPRWTSGEAPAENDYEAQLEQIAGGFVFANPAQVRYGVEVVAGGNFSWNHGVDYSALLARSGMSPLVEALYAKAGAGALQTDLQALARAPRIAATAAAVAAAETSTSYSGKIRGPVIVVDNVADPVDADAFKLAYERTLAKAGTGALQRSTWVRSVGHASQSALERIAGFTALVERLDTGTWSDTSPAAMNARAARIASATTIDLGPSRFIDHKAPEMLRPWDGSNWGSYAPVR